MEHRHKVHLSKEQLRRFAKGEAVHFKKFNDGEIEIVVPPEVHKRILKARKSLKGVRLSKSDVMEGSGIFDAIGHALKRTFSPSGLKRVAKTALPVVGSVAGEALGTAAGSAAGPLGGVAGGVAGAALGKSLGQMGADKIGGGLPLPPSAAEVRHGGVMTGQIATRKISDVIKGGRLAKGSEEAKERMKVLREKRTKKTKEEIEGDGLFQTLSRLGISRKRATKAFRTIGHGAKAVGRVGIQLAKPLLKESAKQLAEHYGVPSEIADQIVDKTVDASDDVLRKDNLKDALKSAHQHAKKLAASEVGHYGVAHASHHLHNHALERINQYMPESYKQAARETAQRVIDSGRDSAHSKLQRLVNDFEQPIGETADMQQLLQGGAIGRARRRTHRNVLREMGNGAVELGFHPEYEYEQSAGGTYSNILRYDSPAQNPPPKRVNPYQGTQIIPKRTELDVLAATMRGREMRGGALHDILNPPVPLFNPYGGRTPVIRGGSFAPMGA